MRDGGAPLTVGRVCLSVPSSAVAFILSLSLFPQPLRAQADSVVVENDVAAKMRDGVVLKSDIYRPKADGKYPVLLQRTPYDKTNVRTFGIKAAARGYVVIAQDVRGRYTSEGEWYPFRHESQDGYDTVEWAAALPDSSKWLRSAKPTTCRSPRTLRPPNTYTRRAQSVIQEYRIFPRSRAHRTNAVRWLARAGEWKPASRSLSREWAPPKRRRREGIRG